MFQVGADDLLRAGYPVEEVVMAGFSVRALQGAGLPAALLQRSGFFVSSMVEHYSLSELREAGYPASDFRREEVERLLGAGYSVRELREAGLRLPAKVCREDGCIAGDLRADGFKAVELLRGGYTLKELSRAGFGDPWQLKIHHNVSTKLLVRAGLCADDNGVRDMRAGVVDQSYMFTVQKLRDAGVTNRNGTQPAWICQNADDGEHRFSPGVPGTASHCVHCQRLKKVCSLPQLRWSAFGRQCRHPSP